MTRGGRVAGVALVVPDQCWFVDNTTGWERPLPPESQADSAFARDTTWIGARLIHSLAKGGDGIRSGDQALGRAENSGLPPSRIAIDL